MKIKSISLLLIITLMVSLTACGQKDNAEKASSASAQEIMEDMNEALKDVKQLELDLSLEMKMSTEYDGENEEIDFDANLDLKAKLDPMGVHLKGAIKGLEIEGQKMDQEIELYALQEGDQYVIYMNTPMMGMEGSWMKMTQSASELGIEEYLQQIESLTSMNADEMETIDIDYSKMKVTEKGNNYIITTSLKDYSGDISNMMDKMMSGMVLGDVESINAVMGMLDKLNAEYKMYVDKDKKLPTKLVLDVSTDGKIDISDLGEGDGTIDIQKGIFELNLKLDNVSDIVVPEDVQSSALDLSNLGF